MSGCWLRSLGDAAIDLLSLVRQLAHEFYESKAAGAVSDLVEMGDLAAKEFRLRHPEITEEAVEPLAWCQTFDNSDGCRGARER